MRLIVAITAILAAASIALSSRAQPQEPSTAPSPMITAATDPRIESPQAGAALTHADLETWLDGYMAFALKNEDVAGAIVAVVKDGEVLLQKGFGYADVKAEKRVVADDTLFRVGSVAKLFIWTAVMQLEEAGRLDLDKDINAYLDFTVPPRDGKPVTMRNLMTHTGGFDEWGRDLWLDDAKDLKPFGEFVRRRVPARIYAPGTTPAYSNYGSALAAYIVERVSGQSFDDYVEQHIFMPLGMTESTFRQPLPRPLQAKMSKGYASAGTEMPFELVSLAPVGSMSSTGSDMARFMLAYLPDGEPGGARILRPDTVQRMHRSPLTILPSVNRMLLGFYEDNRNGRRVVGHDGDTGQFHSRVRLFPDEGVGLFVSVNTGAGYKVRTQLFDDFSDRYFPARAKAQARSTVPAKLAAEHARSIAGHYDNSRSWGASLFNIASLTSQTVVSDNGDGTISLSLAGEPATFREIAPFVWQEVDGRQKLAAKVVDGRVVRFGVDDLPFMVFDRTPWGQTASWLLPALKAALAVFALTVLAWPAAALVRHRYAAPFGLTGRDALAYRAAPVAAVLALAALAAWYVTTSTDMIGWTAKFDPWFWFLRLFGPVAVVGGAALALWHAYAVWTGLRGWFARGWSLVLVLAFAVVLWIALAFDLVAFNVHY